MKKFAIALLLMCSLAINTFAEEATTTSKIDLLTAKIEANPQDDKLIIQRAGAYFEIAEIEKAIVDYNAAIKVNPKSPTAHAFRGLAYLEIDKIKEAMADFTSASEIAPLWPNPHLYKADVYDFLEDYKNAIAHYSKVIELTPESAQSLVSRADCYSRQGNDAKAIEDYTAAIKLAPKWVLPHSSRADAYYNIDQFEKSLADYEATVRIAPKDPTVYEDLGWFLATCIDPNVRNGKEALKYNLHACKMIGMDKLDCVSMDMLAAAYAASGDFKSAVEWQKKAMGCAPSESTNQFETRLKLYESGKSYTE